MIEKDYYRIDELTPIGITEGTIRYFIEQQKLQPVFFIQQQRFVIGAYVKNQFNGCAIATYQGLVSISAGKNGDLLKNGKVTANSVLLLQREKIVISSVTYPFNVPCPNSYITAWQNWTLSEIKLNTIPAKFYPIEHDSGMALFFGIMKLAASTNTQKQALRQSEADMMSINAQRVLNSVGYDFLFQHICIRHKDLLSLGLLKPNIKDQSVNTLVPRNGDAQATDPRCKNEFEELLLSILTVMPRTQAKQMHRILCDEANREEDTRHYDYKNILLSEVEGIITWRDKYRDNAERSYNLGGLRNLLTEVRKMLHQ